MKVVLAIVLLISAVSLSSGGSIDWNKKCTPGDSWKESCHTCLCEADGKPTCSRELCPGEGHIRMVLPEIRDTRETPGGQCQPGAQWKDDCNDCSCTPDGYISCTRMECTTNIKP